MTIVPMALILLVLHRALRVSETPVLLRERSRCNSR
jgi:hypothetical protein